ncbi:hypothetical protein LXA43DRAFT_1012547 [Ganoderma leucocontextum]|nr:hypothetical protein LXA43DRAFT_1012547 [Ganoderma leucocontextum]
MQPPAVPESAICRALTCTDVILEIIEQTSPSDGAFNSQYDRQLLATLALVCRAINGHATKALWSRLDSFIPLMELLSAFDNKVISPDTIPTRMISGDIPSHEFSRFRELGSFIRVVAPTDYVYESDTIDPDAWLYLAQISGGKSLFPSLRELHWTIDETSGTELLFIVSSSLRRLTVCYGRYSTDSRKWALSQSMLFRTIFNVATHLTHLAIDDVDIHEALLPACLSNLRVLRMLRVVSLDQNAPANLDVLRTLSSVESLEELSFAVGSIEPIDFIGFPALKKLRMAMLSGAARPVFNAFSSPSLRELILRDQCYYTNTNEIFATSTIITQRFPSMESLTMTLSVEDIDGVDLSIQIALAPLFPLPLRKLSLEFEDSPVAALTDDFFAALAQSCPQLVELSIMIPDQSDDVPLTGVTSHTLLALARSCPQLQVLQLPRMKSPQPGEVGEYPVLQHPLRTLAVEHPAIASEEEYTTCALLLDRLFPDLDTTTVSPDIILSDSWKRVLYCVRLCQLGRSNRAL